MLEIGHAAPNFTLPDADMVSVKLADYKGHQHVVLYFYPRDDTPSCTVEATEFSDLDDDLNKLHTAVLGVSRFASAGAGAHRTVVGQTFLTAARVVHACFTLE